jgi:Fe-S cluster assembly iron-binding protein IscA
MFTVTATAKQKLREKLQALNKAPEMVIRLISSPSPAKPGLFRIILDKEKKADHVVESEDGIKVLLIGADLCPSLEGTVIDFRKTSRGTGFTVSKHEAPK